MSDERTVWVVSAAEADDQMAQSVWSTETLANAEAARLVPLHRRRFAVEQFTVDDPS